MASLKKIILTIFFSSIAYSQNKEIKVRQSDTIVFSYDKEIYNKIAYDSIKILFEKQSEFYSQKNIKSVNLNCPPQSIDRVISLHYKFNDLYYFPIPRFRLYRDGYEKFDCYSNIENFIVFNEFNKYQYSLVCYKDLILNGIEIPNKIFEMDRIYTPDVFTMYLKSKEKYEECYINSLMDFSKTNTAFYNKILYNKENNFFFEIYGLGQVLFEIENRTGLLYANFSSYDFGDSKNLDTRMPANDFIRKYIGTDIIKELCLGHYLEVDDIIGREGYKNCNSNIRVLKNIILKINSKK